MNCPSRTDESLENEGWNQNPSQLAADLTTRQDMNGMVNLRTVQSSDSCISNDQPDEIQDGISNRPLSKHKYGNYLDNGKGKPVSEVHEMPVVSGNSSGSNRFFSARTGQSKLKCYILHAGRVMAKFSRFIGPGFMVSVAYIDPGNYSTDVAAGASTRFKLLFIVLMSNLFAILLQSLAVRLGTVTGLNLAEHCRAHLPRWLNIVLYVLGEGAIIATDIAEVSYEYDDIIRSIG